MSENTKAILIGFGGTILLILLVALMVNSRSSKDKIYECSSCGKEFTNRDDVSSIAITSMCEPCYDDFKFTQELYNEAEKYKERNR